MSGNASGRRTSLARLGAIVVTVAVFVTYLGFSKHLPWQRAFTFRVAFTEALNVAAGSDVRIAGITVGRVATVGREGSSPLTFVTVVMNPEGLPLRKDARIKVRPRLFLEGNYFLDVSPGTPRAGELDAGGTIPASQTASAVQIDQVLTGLQLNTRDNLRRAVGTLGEALEHGRPDAAALSSATESASTTSSTTVSGTDTLTSLDRKRVGGSSAVDPSSAPENTVSDAQVVDDGMKADPETAGAALNRALANSGPAFKAGARTNAALLGTRRDDLSKTVEGLDRVVGALDDNEVQLKELISNANIAAGALAAQGSNLAETIALLPGTLEAADSAFTSLDSALPAFGSLATDLTPGVRLVPGTVKDTLPWIEQVNGLLGSDELGGVASRARRMAPDLGATVAGLIKLLPEVDDLGTCLDRVVLPTLDKVIVDPPFTDGFPPTSNFNLLAQALVGISGIAQNFDANGAYLRAFQPGGSTPVVTGNVNGVPGNLGDTSQGPLIGLGPGPITGFRPARPSSDPVFKADVKCRSNAVPDLSAETASASSAAVATLDRAAKTKVRPAGGVRGPRGTEFDPASMGTDGLGGGDSSVDSTPESRPVPGISDTGGGDGSRDAVSTTFGAAE